MRCPWRGCEYYFRGKSNGYSNLRKHLLTHWKVSPPTLPFRRTLAHILYVDAEQYDLPTLLRGHHRQWADGPPTTLR